MYRTADVATPVLFALDAVSQSYLLHGQEVRVLQEITLTIRRGESCALVGTSGSGKSTLLNILGLLDRPASGRFHFRDRDVLAADASELALLRNREIGFVFQAFNLLPQLNAMDNVALPLTYRGISRRDARNLAMAQLERVGLAERALHRPSHLSGGQCQRVAIARALVGEPSVILADEPTGNLDPESADSIMKLMLGLNEELGVTLIMVTHDLARAGRMDRQLHISAGCLQETSPHGKAHARA